MEQECSNQKANVDELVKDKKISGFSLVETLLCVFIAQMFWWFAWPHLKDFWNIQRCQIQVHHLQVLLEKSRIDAVLEQKKQKIVPKENGAWSIGHGLFDTRSNLYWHGFNSFNQIVFESKLALNHVNGYFDYHCTATIRYRLWLNRLGHIRIEQLLSGISTMP